jgi:hypothetical protein
MRVLVALLVAGCGAVVDNDAPVTPVREPESRSQPEPEMKPLQISKGFSPRARAPRGEGPGADFCDLSFLDSPRLDAGAR